jgi:hypothetical protein
MLTFRVRKENGANNPIGTNGTSTKINHAPIISTNGSLINSAGIAVTKMSANETVLIFPKTFHISIHPIEKITKKGINWHNVANDTLF